MFAPFAKGSYQNYLESAFGIPDTLPARAERAALAKTRTFGEAPAGGPLTRLLAQQIWAGTSNASEVPSLHPGSSAPLSPASSEKERTNAWVLTGGEAL